MGFWLLVPGVGMGGSGVETPTPRVIYRPQSAVPPSGYRPLSATLPPLYRPNNPTTPAG